MDNSFQTRRPNDGLDDPRFEVTDLCHIRTTANIPNFYGYYMMHKFDSKGHPSGNLDHEGINQAEVDRLRNEALGRVTPSLETDDEGMYQFNKGARFVIQRHLFTRI